MAFNVERVYYQQFASIQPNQPARKVDVELTTIISSVSSVRALELQQQADYLQKTVEIEAGTGLRSILRRSMGEIHKKARDNRFLNQLITGEMSCSKAYVVYLCNLYHLHMALERAQKKICEKYGDGFFVFPVLFRSKRLLEDIKLWSFLNPTAPKFADKEIEEREFLDNVAGYVQPCVKDYAKHLDDLVKEDPIFAVGAIYALYGTVMSGGQEVRWGVKDAFLSRLETKIGDYHDGSLNDDTDEASKIKAIIIRKMVDDPTEKEALADKSVSFFTFEPNDFHITTFRKEWHAALDQIPAKLGLSDEKRIEFEKKMSVECVSSVNIVLDAIASLLEFLKNE